MTGVIPIAIVLAICVSVILDEKQDEARAANTVTCTKAGGEWLPKADVCAVVIHLEKKP